MEISRFPCKRLLRMPGSTTTRGRHVSRDIDTGRVAFCGTENISTPNLSYAAQYLACALPCERFTSALADSPCITRGQCGSLRLHRDGLPPSTFCRSPGAPVHSIITGSGIRCCVETLCRDVDICDDRDDPARGSAVRNLPNRADQSRDQRALDRHRRFFVPILGEPATTRQSLISCLERFHKSPMVAVRDTIPQRAQHIGEPLNKDFSSNRVRYRS